MKNRNVLISFLLFFFHCCNSFIFSQTSLSPGDIAVIAFKTNTSTESGNDAVKLVTFVDLECNTSFIVTDNNWNNSTLSWACDDDESGLQITCNTAIAAGSVFYIDYDAAGNTCTCSGGSISRTDLGSPWGTNFGFNSQGDNVYILQGTRASPSFIYSFKHKGAFSSNTCVDKDQASLPTGLTLGTSAIVMSSTKNQWNYNCSVNSGSPYTVQAAIGNTANWVSNTAHIWDASNCFFSLNTALLPYGVLAVSGSGCGCLAGCNLVYSGGSANCGAGVSGDCTIGYQNMSTNISIPTGCTFKVIAEMKPRNYSCSSSGADGSCQGCDNVKVDILGGSKTYQQGGSNSSITDNYTTAGPATIVVSGSANRADEIITYSIQATPCNCILNILPVELAGFNAKRNKRSVELTWTTMTEVNNKYFTIERSQEGTLWDIINVVPGRGNATTPYNYKIYDSSPLEGISYYRLKQTDLNGNFTYSKTVSVGAENKEQQRNVVRRINLYGQELNENASGLIILIYNTGEAEKVFIE
ncbi:MAG: hypothetical protein ACXVPU_16450 [Bacteroidia bacterium]